MAKVGIALTPGLPGPPQNVSHQKSPGPSPQARASTAMPQTVARRLKIGLSACFQHADPARSLFTNKTLQYVEQSIAHWLMSAGAMVVMVPCPTGETARGDTSLAHYAEWLDGVVMHGGADVWPGSYGEVPLRDAWVGDRIRDLYDLALVEAFEQAGKPIFGVCRGLQLINVAFGGTLYQDLEFQRANSLRHRDPESYDQNYHDIEFVEGTRLSRMYPGVLHARVNSIHHQGIKHLAPEFEVEAWSYPDRVPEAIRRKSHRSYIAATQWHPEFHQPGGTISTVDDTAILNDFLAACTAARSHAPRYPHVTPGKIRDRAARLLRQALLRR
jgi:putative glutamine amidotransferase